MNEHAKWVIRSAHKGDAKQIAAGEEHIYLSTGCLHGEHDYCQSGGVMNSEARGVAVKQPAQCKFCAAPCICDCHQQGTE